MAEKGNFSEIYVDDIICTAKNEPIKLLQEVNDLNPNLEFLPETLNYKRELAY